MLVGWQCLALGAEIGIVADCTLVPIAVNIAAVVLAKRAIAVDVIMDVRTLSGTRERLVECDEPMAWMACSGIFDAC